MQLIDAGYKALIDDVADHDLGLAKIVDGYDDFFSGEIEHFKKDKNN